MAADFDRTHASFDRFQFDLASGELRQTGKPVPVQELPLQVLRLLLKAEGAVVTRENLCTALWPKDTFVDFEHGVNTAVRKLRQALGDSADHPKFIETLPRVGYRFMVPVDWTLVSNIGPAPPAEALQPMSEMPHPAGYSALKGSPRFLKGLGIAFTILLVVGWMFRTLPRSVSSLRPIDSVNPSLQRRPASIERRLTANPGEAPLTGGVISPDGKYIVYSDTTGLLVRHVDTGETFPVPLPKGFEPLPESWFPDSIHLVVARFEDTTKKRPSLWEISIVGGTPRKLAEEGSSAVVSPDGSRVAFSTGPWDGQVIWVFETDRNTATKIEDGGFDSFGPVAWGGNANLMAWVRQIEHPGSNAPERRIEIHDMTTGLSKTIVSDPGLDTNLSWLRTGRLIYSLHESQPNQGDSNLWSIPVDFETGLSSGSPARITNGQGMVSGLSTTTDGKRLALLRRSSQSDVYIADLEAGGDRLSRPRRLTLDDRQDAPSAWTIDSKSVIFVSDRDGPYHIFKQAANQTQPQLVVGGTGDVWLPRLAPGGQGLLYLAGALPGESKEQVNLMQMPLSGGSSKSVLHGTGIVNFQCAKLRSTICILGQLDATTYRFFFFDSTNGRGPEIVGASAKSETGPNSWNLSPDGKYLLSCLSQDPYKASVLRLLNLIDGTSKNIPVPEVKLIVGLDWTANGHTILVTGYMGRGGDQRSRD